MSLDQLVDGAREQGFDVSARLIHDWVAKGLLDKPTRRGLGQGKGTTALWPENQLKLLVSILKKQREGVRMIATLCNIPVSIWLWFGDSYVPVRQVRRALATYADTYRDSSRKKALFTANEILVQYGLDPRRKRVRQFREDLVLYAQRGRLDEDLKTRILQGFAELVPSQPSVGREYLVLVEVKRAASDDIDSLSDEDFGIARARVGGGLISYMKEQPALALRSDAWRINQQTPSLEWLFNNACLHLLTTLGMRAMQRRKLNEIGSAPMPVDS